MLRYAPRFHFVKKWPKKNSLKKFQKIFREIFFQVFLAIVVPQPIWSMPAGHLGPLVLGEIDPAQTVVNPKLKFIYSYRYVFVTRGRHFRASQFDYIFSR
jgi:hypothetical protein